jgi:hypothetical protein
MLSFHMLHMLAYATYAIYATYASMIANMGVGAGVLCSLPHHLLALSLMARLHPTHDIMLLPL